MDTRKPNQIAQVSSDPVTTRRRPLLFLAAYFIGVIIATGIFAFQVRYPYEDWFSWLLEIFLSILFFLPWGVVVALEWLLNFIGINADLILTKGPFPAPLNVLGVLLGMLDYLSFFIIAILGSATRKQRTFRILFFVFIGLLVINIAGCSVA